MQWWKMPPVRRDFTSRATASYAVASPVRVSKRLRIEASLKPKSRSIAPRFGKMPTIALTFTAESLAALPSWWGSARCGCR